MSPRQNYHLVLATGTTATLGLAAASGSWAGAADRLSIVSAYLCLFLLGGALIYGPVHALRDGRPIGNSPIRRSMGIWSALTGLLHFLLANVLAMNYEYLGIHVENAAEPPTAEIRSELYSWGTISGYVVAVLFLVLTALSNDRMLRLLGMKRWKRVQRSSYVVFLLTCGHALAFQILETREATWVYVVLLVSLLIVSSQAFGLFANLKSRTTRAIPKNR